MKLKFYAAIICALSFLLIYLAVQEIAELQTDTPLPAAHNGVLDLSDYEFGLQGSVELNGEWKFVDRQFLTGTEIESGEFSSQTRNVGVPGRINYHPVKKGENMAFGYGTYYLRVLLSSNAQGDFGIKMTNIGLSNNVFVNDIQIGSSGIPGDSKKVYVPSNVPYISLFHEESSYIDIVVWVANYDYSPYGGIVSPICLGTNQQIIKMSEYAKANEVIVTAMLLTLAVIFSLIFVYRRQTLQLLYIGLYCTAGGLYVATHGEKILYSIIPLMDYRIFAKLQFLSAGISILFFLLYLGSYYPTLFKGIIYKALLAAAIVFLPIGIFAPLSIQSQFSNAQMALIVITMLYSVYMMTIGVLQRMEFAVYTGISSVIMLFMVLISIENVLGGKHFETAYLYAQILFVIDHAFLISARLNKTFDEVMKLSGELMIQDKRKNEFLAKTSHEFRTPLHGIMNIIGMYIEKEKRSMHLEDLENMRLVVDISKRLSRLVNDILDFDLLKEGKLRLDKTSFPLEQCLRDIVGVCDRIYEDNKTEIYIVTDNELPTMYMDRDRLTQIMYNLIDNAINHSQSSRVQILAKHANGRTSISVSDNGGGIDPEQLKKVFDLYEHFSDTKASGLGIGLSIVKQLVEYMGGTIKVQSEVGTGTVFTLIFNDVPVPDDSNKGPGLSPDKERIPLPVPEMEGKALKFDTPYFLDQHGGTTVLLVDDSFSNLKIIIDALKTDRHNIIAVKSGAELLDMLQAHPETDLIVLDLLLPDFSGYELCKQLRERKSMVELPILILTAAVNPDDLQYALSLGANDFIHKPYPVNELRARVNSLLYMKNAATLSSKYEIAFLHAQIKPHFLYNALTTIASCCQPDSREARDLILSLAKYLRGTLDFENLGNLVSVEKEMTLVKAYLRIEQARYPHLRVELLVEENIDVQIPPMTLQVLVENAVKHSAVKQEGTGIIKLRIRHIGDSVEFSVQDNGAGIDKVKIGAILTQPEKDGGIGLYNVNTRLLRAYNQGLSLVNLEGHGLRVSFLIPERRSFCAESNRGR